MCLSRVCGARAHKCNVHAPRCVLYTHRNDNLFESVSRTCDTFSSEFMKLGEEGKSRTTGFLIQYIFTTSRLKNIRDVYTQCASSARFTLLLPLFLPTSHYIALDVSDVETYFSSFSLSNFSRRYSIHHCQSRDIDRISRDKFHIYAIPSSTLASVQKITYSLNTNIYADRGKEKG